MAGQMVRSELTWDKSAIFDGCLGGYKQDGQVHL